MDQNEFQEGIEQLRQLSKEDYRQPLEDVLNDPDPQTAFTRLGRLIGVSLKQPFAYPIDLHRPSHRTRSFRSWELAEEAFRDKKLHATWQYRTLEAILNEAPDGMRFASVEQLARDAHYERGFFGYLGRSARKYICGDPKIRKEIEKHVTAGKKAGFSTKHLTPEVLVQAGGLSLAAYLIVHVPVLGFVGAPVIAGFVLVIYSIGIDAFCKYMDDRRTDEEK